MSAAKGGPKGKADSRARPARPPRAKPLELDPRSAGGFTTCHVRDGTRAAIVMAGTSPRCTAAYINNSPADGFRMIVFVNHGPGCEPGKDGGAKLVLGDNGGLVLTFSPDSAKPAAWQKRIISSAVLPLLDHALRASPLHAYLSQHLGDGFKGFAQRALRAVKKEYSGGVLRRFAS